MSQSVRVILVGRHQRQLRSPFNGCAFQFAEYEELKRLLPEMVRFEPTWEELELYKDGGVAIIDQWVCAHARCVSNQVHESPQSQERVLRAVRGPLPSPLPPGRLCHRHSLGCCQVFVSSPWPVLCCRDCFPCPLL